MHSPTVLVVDDSVFAAKALVRVLEQRGLRGSAATTLEQAMHACAAARPSVLVVDVCMPNLDVVEVCRRVRNATRGGRLSVLLMSAQSEQDVRDVIAAVAPDVFMEKRAGAAAVAAKVEELCSAGLKPAAHHGLPASRP